MKKGKWLKKYIDILNNISTVNRFVLINYIVCSIIYALLGFVIFQDAGLAAETWKAVLYYILLFLPILLSALNRTRGRGRMEFRYALYLPACCFYCYLLLLDRGYINFLFVVAMIGMSVIYCDIKFSISVSAYVFLLNIIMAVMQSEDGLDEGRLIYAGLILIIAFFLNFSSGIIVAIRDAKILDISEEKKRFQALAAVDEKWVFEYDIQTDRLYVTKNMSKGNEEKQCIENISKEAKQQRYVLYADWAAFDKFAEQCKAGEPVLEVQLRIRDHKADYLWYQLKARTLLDKNGVPDSVIGTMENIDDRKRMEQRVADENMRDSLTKLYDCDHAKELMSNFLAVQDGTEYAGLLLINVDDFSTLTKKMGTTFANEVLKSMAADLDEIFYTSDILGRVGGDEFMILMKNIKKIPDIEKKMQEIQDVVQKTYSEEEMNFTSTVTIGAAVFPIDGKGYEELYRNAEKALVYEKECGKNRYGLYDAGKEAEYEKLHIEEQHNKIKNLYEQEQTYGRTETASLIEIAFKLIDESKDTDSAINLLLRQVTRQLKVDAICVRHRVGHEYKMTYPYTCVKGNFSLKDQEIVMTKEDWESSLKRIRENGGFFCCSNIDEIEDEQLRDTCRKYEVRSFARCPYYEKDEYIGSLDFVSFTDERKWTREDRQTIQAVTNVISSYLLKMKAYEDASDTIERLTGFDSVTGFYKYEKFLELAENYLKTEGHGQYAIAYFDFSNFKYINENYGYEVGDKILKACADNANRFMDRFIMGSRIVSDNIICLLNVDGWTAEQMVDALESGSQQFIDKIHSKYLTSNMISATGLCTFQADENGVLLKNIISNANLARKEAKKTGKTCCVVYDESMGLNLVKEVEYINNMENAFRNHEFVVYMQPKINLKNQKIIGAEALVRWIKPDGEVICPNDFIPVFEKNKSVTLLDYFVYDEVCKYLAHRIKLGERAISISMNVSRVHLQSIDEIVSYVRSLLQRYEIPSKYLEFELTETIPNEKVEDAVTLLTKLRELGFKVSMDDFGAGYSSLNTLTKLPLDVLKLDKEFLKDFDTDSDEKIIIPSIIDMAKKLNLDVVCEGVETKQQADFLRDVDCDIVQGYYYSEPVPLDVFSGMLADDDFFENHSKKISKERALA